MTLSPIHEITTTKRTRDQLKTQIIREHESQIKIPNVTKNQYQHHMPIQTNQIKTKIQNIIQ